MRLEPRLNQNAQILFCLFGTAILRENDLIRKEFGNKRDYRTQLKLIDKHSLPGKIDHAKR